MEQPQEKGQGSHVLQTPVWIIIIRGFQFLFSLIIVGLCARLMHDATLPEEAFSLAVAIITWVVLVYSVFTEKIPSLRNAYHIIAVLALDGLLVILWLAAWAATAARRAKYVVPVNAGNCRDDGSLTDSKTCTVFKRDGENVILFKSGLAMLAAVAGIGALIWVLFIATFAWTVVMFTRGRKEGHFAVDLSGSGAPNTYQMEPKAEAQPMVTPVQPVQPQGAPQQYQQQPASGQYPPQQQQQYPPQGAPGPHSPAQSPYQQQGAYPPPAAPYSPQDQQYQGQQNHGQYPPQQFQQSQPYGSELSAQTPLPQYSTPPPASMSPPPQPQPYPPQAYPQQ
ncbi:hypothetical protein F53441_10622 [Fusarium austroafricanum]|uniref:MARVEL domain-containing protein n=1 Tax=Fusarium austroafricanum TaxID=2364996 RepID=A0A8H4KA29_9HYPO|nr:hypothetical protein F53441_10622 [Fusarium austroafricanum]